MRLNNWMSWVRPAPASPSRPTRNGCWQRQASKLAWRGGADQEKWRLLLGVGLLGGFTTFSAYSLEVALMIERRAYGQAALYSVGSVLLSVAALFAGLILVRRLLVGVVLIGLWMVVGPMLAG